MTKWTARLAPGAGVPITDKTDETPAEESEAADSLDSVGFVGDSTLREQLAAEPEECAACDGMAGWELPVGETWETYRWATQPCTVCGRMLGPWEFDRMVCSPCRHGPATVQEDQAA